MEFGGNGWEIGVIMQEEKEGMEKRAEFAYARSGAEWRKESSLWVESRKEKRIGG